MDHSVAIENYATKAADTLTKYLEKEPEPVLWMILKHKTTCAS